MSDTKIDKLNSKKTLISFVLLLFGLTSLPLSAYGQEHGIHQIEFNFQHSLRIPNHFVSVEFISYEDSIMVHVKSEPMDTLSEKWKRTLIDYTFELPQSEFDKVVEAVQKINCADITSGVNIVGVDGTTCEISFGSYGNEISYKVWSPDIDTKNRNLQAYLDACTLILETAKLDPKEIF